MPSFCRTLLIALLAGLAAASAAVPAEPSAGRDLHVDPVEGNDAGDGLQKPVRTIGRAIRLAQPGDTIHLRPVEYRDQATFLDKSGAPGRPITLDGHGATLNGCDPLDAAAWTEVSPGLYRHDNLLSLTDAIIGRWFFLQNGKPNRMERCSKGPSQPLKAPEALQPGEWTFVKNEERTKAARPGYIYGTFWIRTAEGQSLAEAGIEAPLRMAGVSMHGTCSHLVIRNVTSIHPYNDGFNLSNCRDVTLENIRAIDCGDDGISAHGECDYTVTGFASIGNATGICDTGHSRTSYRRVLIRDCIGFDLYFLDTGTYSVQDALLISSAAKSVYLSGRETPAEPCRLTLENVLIRREKTENEIRVSTNCELTARRTTFLGLDLQATGGAVRLDRCLLGGDVPVRVPASATPRKPRLHLWPEAVWSGRHNLYELESVRVGQATLSGERLSEFPRLVREEIDSRLQKGESVPGDIGADLQSLAGLESMERDP
ncbi:right-handed parallel beta-helix repeat-containing protein [Planctomyces sp. SH-PL14]|uniref:right-handed parallel beta-helix repeat-containing protein n=1 Tax=Planctomyces sp. SH-PL14 TaxID=1632864 RepID=UPI00078D4AF7|nr:right-handed parallel beta-helix repeat-containing protein [Planctomyces sp. SH-PL14]AMV21525.1 hypothetical protein VT03_26720 [Planctomyces sp. SH-PL14]